MRSRLRQSLTDRATIRRRDDDVDDVDSSNGDDDGGLYDGIDTSSDSDDYDPGESYDDVAEDVPCQFSSESTEYVRSDSGENVQNPATVTFDAGVDVEENDRVLIDRVDTVYEVAGVDQATDSLRGLVVSVECELRRDS